MSIVISGASGAFGQKATKQLLEAVPAAELILVTRSPEKLKEFAAKGAQVRYGDLDRPETVREAFKGGDKLLLISTLDVGERRRRQHQAAIEAAGAAGVRHVVYTSSVGIHPKNPAYVVIDHLYTEELLRASGMAWTFMRDAQYAEVITTMMAPVALATGKWESSAQDGCMAFVSKQDCVDCAVAVLTKPGHENAAYEITGPELLTFRDCARITAEVYGKPIQYADITHEQMQANFDAAGVPRKYTDGMHSERGASWGSEEMMSYEQAIRESWFAVASHHVKLILGRPAKSLREVLVATRGARYV